MKEELLISNTMSSKSDFQVHLEHQNNVATEEQREILGDGLFCRLQRQSKDCSGAYRYEAVDFAVSRTSPLEEAGSRADPSALLHQQTEQGRHLPLPEPRSGSSILRRCLVLTTEVTQATRSSPSRRQKLPSQEPESADESFRAVILARPANTAAWAVGVVDDSK